MKSRIKTKFLVFLALATLLINVFTSFSTVFVQAKTTTSGYKIDVSYQNGIAKLTGNSTAVLSGYQLTTLTDDSTGQQYNPNNFSIEVTKNDIYTFTLGYSLNGISKETRYEKVTVVIDRLNKGNAKAISATDAIPTSELSSKATNSNITVGLYANENYNPDDPQTAKKLGSMSIPSGMFENNLEEINTLIKQNTISSGYIRQFSIGTIVRKNDNSEFQIYGIWNVNGTMYYSLDEKNVNSTNKIGISYKLEDGDEIRIYSSVVDAVKYKLDTQQLTNNGFSNINLAPTPDSTGMVVAGSNVRISFNWPNYIQSVTLKVDGKNVPTTKYDEYTRSYVGNFTMPSKKATIECVIVKKQNTRWAAVYDNSSSYFQPFEIGGTTLSINTSISGGGSAATAKVWRQYGTDGEWGLHPITYGPSIEGQVYKNTEVYNESFRIVSGGKQIETGDLDGSQIKFPVQDYTSGQDVMIDYYSHRSTGVSVRNKTSWWKPPNNYEYSVPISGRIDIFNSQGQINTTNYKTESFKMYQTKEDYEKSKLAGETYSEDTNINVPESSSNSAKNAGYYPVQTVLSNGTRIICYPTTYNKQQGFDEASYMGSRYIKWNSDDSSYSHDVAGLGFDFKIVVQNSYDDFRIVLGDGISTANNWGRASVVGNGIDSTTGLYGRGNSNTGITKPADNNGNLFDGNVLKTIFVAAGSNAPTISGHKFTYFRVKPKDGYSVPIPKMTLRDFGNNKLSYIDSSKVGIKSRVTSSTIDETSYKNIGDNFVAGLIGTSAPFYSSDGYFNYSLFVNQDNGSVRDITFESKPIQFNVNYSGTSSNSGSGYNVETKRYFTIPVAVPNMGNGQFFQGYQLEASGDGLGKTVIVPNEASSDSYFKPSDLIDVSEIYSKIKKEYSLPETVVGKTNITLTFVPKSKKVGAGEMPPSGQGKISEYYQASSSSYGTTSVDTIVNAISGSSFQITGVSDVVQHGNASAEYSRNQNKTEGSEFITGFKPQVSGPVQLLSVYYDKEIGVVYDLNSGTGIPVPTDNNKYTTMSNTSNNNEITVTDSVPTSPTNGKKFVGWQIQVTTSSGVVSGTYNYQPGAKINLSTLSNETSDNQSKLREAIFNAGQVTLVAQYQDEVAAIQTPKGQEYGDTPVDMATTGDWVYEGKSFKVTATFKYNGTKESFDKAKETGFGNPGGIHVALYKNNPAGKSGANQYQLWWGMDSTGKNVTSYENNDKKVDGAPVLSDLGKDGTFTVTFTIKNLDNNITYDWDNNAKYRIYAWTKTNGVDGNKFNGETGYAKETLDVGNGQNGADSPTKLPWGTTTTRVLEPFKIVGDSNTITKKKLIYSDGTPTISFDFTTQHQISLTSGELSKETHIALAKIEPSGGEPKVWYLKNSSHSSGIFTDQGTSSSKAYKSSVPNVSIKSSQTSSGNTFTVTVSNISDEANGKSNPRWTSKAHYILYVWNDANTNAPSLTDTTKNGKVNYNISNASAIKSPQYDLQTYIVDENSSTDEENKGKAYNGIITYPQNVPLRKMDNGNVESSDVEINLSGVWTEWSGNSGVPGKAFEANQVDHDYSYLVKIKQGAGDATVSADNTSLVLTQKGITGGKSFTANVLKDGTSKLQNGNLGTLNFATNGNPVASLKFKVIGKAPEFSSRDRFSGTMQYDFIKQSVNKGGG